MKRQFVLAMVCVTVGFLLATGIGGGVAQDAKDKAKADPGAGAKGVIAGPGGAVGKDVAPKDVGPKDEAIYVWQQPDRGYQSVIILKAVSGTRLECGLLVPIVLELDGIQVIKGKEDEVVKSLNDAAVGRMMTAALAGRRPDGVTNADLWAGSDKGWLKNVLLKSGLYEKVPVPAKK